MQIKDIHELLGPIQALRQTSVHTVLGEHNRGVTDPTFQDPRPPTGFYTQDPSFFFWTIMWQVTPSPAPRLGALTSHSLQEGLQLPLLHWWTFLGGGEANRGHHGWEGQPGVQSLLHGERAGCKWIRSTTGASFSEETMQGRCLLTYTHTYTYRAHRRAK